MFELPSLEDKVRFEYENNFYLTCDISRISKFATHLELFKRVSGRVGDIIECGVFKGASLSRFIKFRSLFENVYSKKIIAFDIFGKFPDTKYEKGKEERNAFVREAGENSISKNRLSFILEKLNLNQNIELVEGDIQETVPEYMLKNPHQKISLLHVDVDLYESTKVCLEVFSPLVVRGGYSNFG